MKLGARGSLPWWPWRTCWLLADLVIWGASVALAAVVHAQGIGVNPYLLIAVYMALYACADDGVGLALFALKRRRG